MAGKSAMRRPGRRRRLSTKSQGAKLGSMTTFCPPICRKKLAWPMKVTPSSPLVTSCGLWVWPWRGVTADRRTRRPKFEARLRRAGLLIVFLIILLLIMLRRSLKKNWAAASTLILVLPVAAPRNENDAARHFYRTLMLDEHHACAGTFKFARSTSVMRSTGFSV